MIFDRDCGAASGIVLHISLVDGEPTLPSGVGNLFRARDTSALPIHILSSASIQWLSDTQLQVSYDQRAAVLLQRSHIGRVQVIFNPIRGTGP
jgi:hypothetical protein